MVYLRELLLLFINQSSSARTVEKSFSFSHTTLNRQLLDTLSVIEIILAGLDVGSESSFDEELVLLFRNMWLIATALGLMSPSIQKSDGHQVALKNIAAKTPCLLQNTPLNYVETELEYNPILRREHDQVS